jgi:hypothetical protein
MNIVDFTKSLSYDNLETDLLRYFDENMILYRLMGGVPGVVVSSISNSTKAIYRISSTDASTDLNILAQYINNTITTMYGAIYIKL